VDEVHQRPYQALIITLTLSLHRTSIPIPSPWLSTPSTQRQLTTPTPPGQPNSETRSYTVRPLGDAPDADPRRSAFNPYSDNGGTILAIAGKDFSVIAGDTRQSEGYSIQTRYARKVWQL
jgi:hypothetical protein